MRDTTKIKLEELIDFPFEHPMFYRKFYSLIAEMSFNTVLKLDEDSLEDIKEICEDKILLDQADSIQLDDEIYTYSFSFGTATVQDYINIQSILEMYRDNNPLFHVLAFLIFNENQRIYFVSEISEMSENIFSEQERYYYFKNQMEKNEIKKKTQDILGKIEYNYSKLLKMPVSWVWDKCQRFNDSNAEFIQRWPAIFGSTDEKDSETLLVHENLEEKSTAETLYTMAMFSIDDRFDLLPKVYESNVNEWMYNLVYRITKNKELQAAEDSKNKITRL